MKKNIIIAVIVFVLVGIGVYGNHMNTVNELKVAKPVYDKAVKKDKVIGLSIDQGFESRINVTAAIKRVAGEKGYVVKEMIAEGDAQMQNVQIQSLLSEGIDVLLVCAVDQNLIENTLMEVKSKGVPIVAFDRNLPDSKAIDTYVGPDSIDDGMTCGYAMIAIAMQKKEKAPIYVLELVGALNDQNGIDRSKGFHIAMNSMPEIEVIQVATDWDEKSAKEAVRNAFQIIPEIKAVFCATDAFVPGVNSVLEQMGLKLPVGSKGHICVNGINGSKEGYKAVIDDEIDGFMVMDLERIGRTTVEMAQNLMNEKPVQKLNLVESTYYNKEEALRNKNSIWGASDYR